MNKLVPISSPALPALVAAAGERASMRFLEFFAANIRNPHTRRAYYRAAEEFLTWCASAGVPSIAAVQPVHVAAWIDAALGMNVEDVYTQNRLVAYLDGAGLRDDPQGPLSARSVATPVS